MPGICGHPDTEARTGACRAGSPEKHDRRAVIDAILYVVRTGCAWRYLPIGFPPWQTVYAHFTRLNSRGVTERILTELRSSSPVPPQAARRAAVADPIPLS
ncbi:hypothetical protein C5N14_09585 [Micromonospora sp. MW-13]|uniref:transposase n=1 Tax=Micromonospora sp. MW-13 TaxID=2094022 RepID=UPI000E45352A|nr:hypothetical protein C5N14_09585 [Micromonospora sp. MW-13]